MVPPPPAGAHALTVADLEPFLDGTMPVLLEEADVAGAVIAVVKDGKVLFAKGYGYADVASRRPVSPESTLFRPGSISKLFTWTSVMQQVERGSLDLDRDINAYLDFQVPPAFGRPITLRDLMTHRAGFEETAKDLFVGAPADLRPLSEYLPAHLPARIYPPGTVPAYSNYGATLAAYIVQRVTGQSFDAYVGEHILGPLGMTSSTFQQPLPAALAPRMSTGYDRASAGPKAFELIEVAPAGAMSTSAADMTRFMIAHLQGGRFGTAQILQPATVETMHARQPGWPAALTGAALGFYESSRNGHRIIGHGGDTDYFHSEMYLLLDAGLGFFVSCNSAGNGRLSPQDVVFDRFMDRYFSDSTPRVVTMASALGDARRVAGTYMSSRRSQTNVRAVTGMLGEITIAADPVDSTIVVASDKGLNGVPKHFREVAPDVFREVGGPEQVAFVTGATGRRTAYMTFPFEVYQRVDAVLDEAEVNLLLLAGCLGMLLLTLLGWPVSAIVRKHFGAPLALAPGAMRLRLCVRAVCAVDLAVAALGALALDRLVLGNATGLGPGADTKLHAVQALGFVGVLGTLVVIYSSWRSWSDHKGWIWSKIWNTSLALSCIGFAWFLLHWHVLNVGLHY